MERASGKDSGDGTFEWERERGQRISGLRSFFNKRSKWEALRCRDPRVSWPKILACDAA